MKRWQKISVITMACFQPLLQNPVYWHRKHPCLRSGHHTFPFNQVWSIQQKEKNIDNMLLSIIPLVFVMSLKSRILLYLFHFVFLWCALLFDFWKGNAWLTQSCFFFYFTFCPSSKCCSQGGKIMFWLILKPYLQSIKSNSHRMAWVEGDLKYHLCGEGMNTSERK